MSEVDFIVFLIIFLSIFSLVFINGYIADYQKNKPSYMFRFRHPDDFPFRPGDKVRLKSGWLFPNKQLVATVEKVECSMIKLKGIDRRVYEGSLVIAEDEIEQAYFAKNKVNHERQDNRY